MLKRRPLSLLLCSVLCASPLWAADKAYDLKIPQQSLHDALTLLAHQSGLEIVYESSLVADRVSPEVQGWLTAEQALQRLLSGTGLDTRVINGGAIAISAEDVSPSARGSSLPLPVGGSESREASDPQSQGDGESPEGERHAPRTISARPGESRTLDAVVVTGTRIRGGETPSRVITIGSERIREEGFKDLGEVIRSVPANYTGGQNPGVIGAGSGSSNITNQNGSGGSGLNLRGLGPDATLTLLNGRRMAYNSFAQAIDISAIPVEAVDRIEIVTDGASAIYGSDAVAGVGNVVLKRDFEGVQVGARYGHATNGGLATREYSLTTGATWSSGGLIASYQTGNSDPVFANQRKFTQAMLHPRTIYPGMELDSALVSAYQALGIAVELRVDALRTKRMQAQNQAYPTFYYDSPTNTTTQLLSPSLEVSLPGDWRMLIGGSWGKDENMMRTYQVLAQAAAPTLVSDACYCNESKAYEIGADGPLFATGGGDARLAVGAGYRTNEFATVSYLTSTVRGGDESSRFAYAELNVPLVVANAPHGGVRRLELSAAVRAEDYDSFGRISTPKFGVIYGPTADFTLKASWGKSFKAPTLDQTFQPRYAYLYSASAVGGVGYPADATVLMSWGGSTTPLQPERATSWAASLAFHPEALPGLEAELTWFDIDYTDRVIQPLTGHTQSLSNPALAEFIHYAPTLQEQTDLIAAYAYRFYNNTGAPYDPSTVVAIGRGEFTNARRQWIQGADLSGSYRFDLGAGRLTVRGSASWLDIKQQLVQEQAPFDVSGQLHYPAKLRARAGLIWAQGGFTGSGFANYIEGVTSHPAPSMREKTASYTTLDATLRFQVDEDRGIWSRMELSLYAQNLLDRAPPLHTTASPTLLPYDSSNYSAIGRFIGASVSKHW